MRPSSRLRVRIRTATQSRLCCAHRIHLEAFESAAGPLRNLCPLCGENLGPPRRRRRVSGKLGRLQFLDNRLFEKGSDHLVCFSPGSDPFSNSLNCADVLTEARAEVNHATARTRNLGR
jgi:hypothetical protein